MTPHRPVRTRRRTARPAGLAAAVALAAALAAGCSSSAGTPAATTTTAAPATTAVAPATGGTTPGTAAPAVAASSPGCITDRPRPTPSTHVDLTMTSGGAERTYKQYVPASYDGATAVPLVVDLHGYQEGNAVHTAMSNLAATSEAHGFALVTPQGSVGEGIPYWNSVPNPDGPPDLAYVSDLIDEAGRTLCLDPRRVYVTGLSNGAFMTSLVGCRLADKVAAIAPVAGLQLAEGCDPARPIPVVAFHGTDDEFVTYDGATGSAAEKLPFNPTTQRNFEGMTFQAIPDALAGWAKAEGCAATPTETTVTDTVTLIAYTGCEGGSTVELYRATGAGHTWPGSAFSASIANVVGTTDRSIDANELMWAFFEQHPLPAT